jgi:putative oxidoreductase
MGVAAFVVHAEDPFGKMEKALLYLFGYLLLAMTGPGKYSLDHLLDRERR